MSLMTGSDPPQTVQTCQVASTTSSRQAVAESAGNRSTSSFMLKLSRTQAFQGGDKPDEQAPGRPASGAKAL